MSDPHEFATADNWQHAVVALLSLSGKRVLGSGFVASERGLIVTCAHVVAEICGTDAGPGKQVLVRFALEDEARPATVTAWWLDANEGDVAVLALEGPLPAGIPIIPLSPAGNVEGDSLRAFGYPHVGDFAGLWGDGYAQGLVRERGLQLLQFKSDDITNGFSGAPLWDENRRAAVGVIRKGLTADKAGRQARTTFAVPADVVAGLCPELDLVVRADLVGEAAEDRFLDVAVPETVVVGRQTELLAMIRLPDSDGLRGILAENEFYDAGTEDVHAEDFEILFPTTPGGEKAPVNVIISVEGADFDIPKQSREIVIPPGRDSTHATFLITPLKAGTLSLLIGVEIQDALLASGFLKVNGRSRLTEGVAVLKKRISVRLGTFAQWLSGGTKGIDDWDEPAGPRYVGDDLQAVRKRQIDFLTAREAIAREKGDLERVAATSYQLGATYLRLGTEAREPDLVTIQQAAGFFQEAAQRFEHLDRPESVRLCLTAFAEAQTQVGNLELAAGMLERARVISEFLEDAEFQAELNERLGVIHFKMGDPESGVEFSLVAAGLHHAQGRVEREVTILRELPRLVRRDEWVSQALEGYSGWRSDPDAQPLSRQVVQGWTSFSGSRGRFRPSTGGAGDLFDPE